MANHSDDVSLFRIPIWRNAAVFVRGALFSDFPLFLPTFSTSPLPSTAHVCFWFSFRIFDVLIYDTFFPSHFSPILFGKSARDPHRFHSYFYIPSMNLFDACTRTVVQIIVSRFVSNAFPLLFGATCSNQLSGINLVDQFFLILLTLTFLQFDIENYNFQFEILLSCKKINLTSYLILYPPVDGLLE